MAQNKYRAEQMRILKHLRTSKGFTLARLEVQSGLDGTRLFRLENGVGALTICECEALEKAYSLNRGSIYNYIVPAFEGQETIDVLKQLKKLLVESESVITRLTLESNILDSELVKHIQLLRKVNSIKKSITDAIKE